MRKLFWFLVWLFAGYVSFNFVGRLSANITTLIQLITLLGIGYFLSLMLVSFLYYIIKR